jgi:hypothetical protein
VIPNRVLIGNRGSGKSVSLEVMMAEVASEASILLIDWPGTLADRMTARLCDMGLEQRLIVDKAIWTDKMPQWPFRRESRATDPLARALEEQMANENLLLYCFARRYEKDSTLAPSTYRSALAALRVYYGIPGGARPPLSVIPHLFHPRDAVGRWLLDATADQEAATFFHEAARAAHRSPQQWDYLAGAGGRLLDVLSSPAIWARSGHSLDWQAAIRDRRHYLLGMEGLPQTAATSLAILAYAPAIQAVKELFEETRRPHPLVVVLEEAGALSLVTPIITTAMQALRKHGVSVWIASQTIHDFRDETTFEALLSMSEHYWHQMTSGVERAARDCADPTYDPNRVLHTRERLGVRRYEEKATRTERVDADGWTIDVSRGTRLRPVVGVQVEKTYDNPANHEAELRHLLSTLSVGERVRRCLDGTVRKESVRLPEEPWGPFAGEEITQDGKTRTLAEHRLQAAFRRIRSSLIYQPPPVWTHPPSLSPSAPTPIPAPATGGGPSGMHGS